MNYSERAHALRHEWIPCREDARLVCIRRMVFDSEGRQEVTYYPDPYEFVTEADAIQKLEKLEEGVHEYLFDFKVFSSCRITAASEKEAREKLAELIDCCTVNFGAIDGEPVIGEASLDGEADLIEVDGEEAQ